MLGKDEYLSVAAQQYSAEEAVVLYFLLWQVDELNPKKSLFMNRKKLIFSPLLGKGGARRGVVQSTL